MPSVPWTPQPHEWSPESIARFWDFHASRTQGGDQYFTAQVGQGIAGFLSYLSPIRDQEILDLGAGTGGLVSHLLDRGASVTALDPSKSSVDAMNRRFADRPGWRGAVHPIQPGLPFDDGRFDVLTAIEVIEHLLPGDLAPFLAEILRVLRPHGFALLTTPHEEILDREITLCPDCGCTFHRWQHVRAWSATELGDELRRSGFDVVFCNGVNLWRFQDPVTLRPSHLGVHHVSTLAKQATRRLLDRFLPRPFPLGRAFARLTRSRFGQHLVAVARRPGGR